MSVDEFVADDGGLDPTFLTDDGSPAVSSALQAAHVERYGTLLLLAILAKVHISKSLMLEIPENEKKNFIDGRRSGSQHVFNMSGCALPRIFAVLFLLTKGIYICLYIFNYRANVVIYYSVSIIFFSSDDEADSNNPMVAGFAEDLDDQDLLSVATDTTRLDYGEHQQKPIKPKSSKTHSKTNSDDRGTSDKDAIDTFLSNISDSPVEDSKSNHRNLANRSSTSSIHSNTNVSLRSEAKSSSISASYEIVSSGKEEEHSSARSGRRSREENRLPVESQFNDCSADSDSDSGGGNIVIAGYSSDVEIDPVVGVDGTFTSPKSNPVPKLDLQDVETPDNAGGVAKDPQVSTIDSWLAASDNNGDNQTSTQSPDTSKKKKKKSSKDHESGDTTGKKSKKKSKDKEKHKDGEKKKKKKKKEKDENTEIEENDELEDFLSRRDIDEAYEAL